ncbi:MAG: hypothetical protein C0515_04260 [Novosphingobium sp.]|nr:hypothetical protein [Novosphingobium sp.]
MPQRQVPAVCAASRQSAGGLGSGGGAGAGAGAGTGAGTGAGLGGAAQDATSSKPSTIAPSRREGAFAFTRLLWKEARQ